MPKVNRRKKVDRNTALAALRHSASHLLAAAVLNLYPKTRLGIGPATLNGFYYDFQFAKPPSEEELPRLEREMRRLAQEKSPFKRSEKTIAAALKWAKDNGQLFKEELINDLKKAGHKKVSFYTLGGLVDLCQGPHLKSAGEIKAFKLISLAGAYWRGDERNPQLTRIYGTAFPDEEELKNYLAQLAEAKKRDHRLLGERLDLFSFQREGPAFPFWHPKGTQLINLITDYLSGLLQESGYLEIKTPVILSEELWRQSGHFEHYQNNMYFTEIEGRRFAIKPMNCPGAVLVFKDKMRSYRDLPLRLSEFGLVHRHEPSGVVHALFRARAFTQDDAHIFCTQEEKQIKAEIKAAFKLVQVIYRAFGFSDYRVELSTRPTRSIGSEAAWQSAEKIMRAVLKEEKIQAQINPSEGAFYGPKLDFHINDSLGRSWQLGTIQLDFSMPERLGAFYIDRQGEKKIPVMIHRALLGSLERFVGILLEHYDGALPLWLSPLQVVILPVGLKHLSYARRMAARLKEASLRTAVDESDETVSKKVRNAELQKIPYIVVVGEKEIKGKKLAVRARGSQVTALLSLGAFQKKLTEEIKKSLRK